MTDPSELIPGMEGYEPAEPVRIHPPSWPEDPPEVVAAAHAANALTVREAWEPAQVHGRVAFLWLGEDGEQALAYGSVVPQEFNEALQSDGSLDDTDPETFEDMLSAPAWWVARPHLDDCPNRTVGPLPGPCGCGSGAEWGAWFEKSEEGAPGAFLATYWSC